MHLTDSRTLLLLFNVLLYVTFSFSAPTGDPKTLAKKQFCNFSTADDEYWQGNECPYGLGPGTTTTTAAGHPVVDGGAGAAGVPLYLQYSNIWKALQGAYPTLPTTCGGQALDWTSGCAARTASCNAIKACNPSWTAWGSALDCVQC